MIPETTPVALTVATPVASDVQALAAAGVPDPVKALVAPSQSVKVPPMVGNGFTVMVDVVIQPSEFI